MARAVVPEAEELLDKEIQVLDKGFVRLVDYMGGDLCYMSGCDPNALTYFIYQNFTFLPYTIAGTPFPGGTITGTTSFGTGEMVLVSEATTPEPATWVLLSSGALGLIGTMKRKSCL